METCARLSTHRPGLFRAAICISKEVRIGSRAKRTKAARAVATDNLNVSTRIHAYICGPLGTMIQMMMAATTTAMIRAINV